MKEQTSNAEAHLNTDSLSRFFYVALRPDQNPRLSPYPHDTKSALEIDRTAFRHIDFSIPSFSVPVERATLFKVSCH